jgi:signal peptidase I
VFRSSYRILQTILMMLSSKSQCLGLSMYPKFSRTGTFLLVSRIHRRIDPSPAPSFSTSHAHQDTRSDLKPTYKPSHSVFGPINRGDLVIAISPFDPSIQVCKRVIGLPGDTVCANPGPPPSSSHQLPSSSSSSRSGGGAPSQFDEIDEFLGLEDGKKVYVKIPKGHVWLQGDNLSNSTDSRVYGPVPLAMIKGKVLARVSRSFGGF